MSRIGKKPIAIPPKTDVTIGTAGLVTVKGPHGELSRAFKSDISVKIIDNEVIVKPINETNQSIALWGTYASHITNMIKGVNELFNKKLIIEGVGFRVSQDGSKLTFSLGFSHPVIIDVPSGINVVVEKNNISISGINKEEVGQFSAYIRSQKKPEPYKGKGIRYSDEVIRRKQGKKTA